MMMKTLQMLIDSGVSGSWILTIFASVVAYFVIRTMAKIEKRMDSQERQIGRINLIQLKILTRLGVDDEYFEELSKEVQTPNE